MEENGESEKHWERDECLRRVERNKHHMQAMGQNGTLNAVKQKKKSENVKYGTRELKIIIGRYSVCNYVYCVAVQVEC